MTINFIGTFLENVGEGRIRNYPYFQTNPGSQVDLINKKEVKVISRNCLFTGQNTELVACRGNQARRMEKKEKKTKKDRK